MSDISRKLMGVTKGAVEKSVTLNGSGTKTDSLTETYQFNYGDSIPAGSFVVVVVTARGGTQTPVVWDSVTDDAGNTFSEAVDGRQNNGLTFTAIYYAQIGSAVTTDTTITAIASGSTSYLSGQHHSIFVLSGVSGLQDTDNAPADFVSLVSGEVTTSSGSGIAIHAISTAFLTTSSVNSVSSGFNLETSLAVVGSQHFTASSIVDQSSGTAVSNTFDMSLSGRWASVMAIFE